MSNDGAKSQLVVTVIGLGFVGLPLVVKIAKNKRYQVFGLDSNEQVVKDLQKRKTHLQDINQEDLQHTRVVFTANPLDCLPNANIVVICVPTPITQRHTPDYTSLENAMETVVAHCSEKTLICVESSVAPGTCQEKLLPMTISAGWSDPEMCHCPERINPGDKHWKVDNISRVIGANTPTALKKSMAFYSSFLEAPIRPMASMAEAEMVKMLENTFRDVNIALVNELAEYAEKIGVNLPAVIDGAATKPFSFLPHYPGCGVGGDCIATDPYYLLGSAKKVGVSLPLIKVARSRNELMPTKIVEKLVSYFTRTKLKKLRFLVLGLAYKPETSDMRRSPALQILSKLKAIAPHVKAYDPFLVSQSDFENLATALEWATVVVICTAHHEFVKKIPVLLSKNPQIIVVSDGRNCIDRRKITELGISYFGVGR
jgi:UDP-N-acetyl-D-glucosamine dehydrogenase